MPLTLRSHMRELRDSDREALRIAKAEIDRRLVQMNELRDQISEERGQYVKYETYDAKHEALINLVNGTSGRLDQRLNTLEGILANLQGRLTAYGAVIAVLAALLGAALVKFVT